MTPRSADTLTTIPVRKATRDRLKQLGSKGDTYDTILNRLIDQSRPARRPGLEARGVVDFEPVD